MFKTFINEFNENLKETSTCFRTNYVECKKKKKIRIKNYILKYLLKYLLKKIRKIILSIYNTHSIDLQISLK